MNYRTTALQPGKLTLPKLLALLLIVYLVLSLQMLYGVRGRVVDEAGLGIGGASITDKRQVVYTDNGGHFSLDTASDSLYVSRPGYESRALKSESTPMTIRLSSQQIVLPRVWVRALEYRTQSPSLGADIIHPDTNAKAESAQDLLLQNSSFSSSDTRLMGERQTVSLLGTQSRHSLVMLDGLVLNAGGEAYDLSKIPLSQISHIEIIKGNSSVYGGSAAMGGIIHFHTRKGGGETAWEAGLASSMGSFGLFKQVYQARLRRGYYTVNAEYTHQEADNDFDYNTPEFWGSEPVLRRQHNRKVADSFFAKAGYFDGARQLDYSLNLGSFVRQLPGPINFLELYDHSRLTGSYLQQSLRAQITQGIWANELNLWWNRDLSTYRNLGSSTPFGTAHYTQEQVNLGAKNTASVRYEDSTVALSAEYSNVDYLYTNLLGDSGITGIRDNAALALRAQQDFYPFLWHYKAALALRGDYSEAKLHPSWRIEQELELPLAVELLLGGYLGTAFSQPSLFDMYWIGDSETQGNPDLRSESSFGYSTYLRLNTAIASLKAAYYYSSVEDLIQWRQYYMNGVVWKPFNVGGAEISNWELEMQAEPLRYLQMGASFTFTDARDVSLDNQGNPSPSYRKRLVYTPSLKAALSLGYGDDSRGISLRYHYTGEQYSTVDNLIDPLPDFDTLDAAAFYRLKFSSLELQLDLKANNLLNRRYEIYAYIPQPGFNWTLGLGLKYRAREKS